MGKIDRHKKKAARHEPYKVAANHGMDVEGEENNVKNVGGVEGMTLASLQKKHHAQLLALKKEIAVLKQQRYALYSVQMEHHSSGYILMALVFISVSG
jgi:hypothetical protein